MTHLHNNWIRITEKKTLVIDPIIENKSANISMFYRVFECLSMQ